jgi:PadR family transcriptional regulator, regulatory protein PadR
MARRPNSSKQTEALLAALTGAESQWRHGYDLSRETGLKSGTLYPILMRLERQGWLEARWEDEPAPGKPRRHLYRLTALGSEEAQTILRAATEPGAIARLVTAPEGRGE